MGYTGDAAGLRDPETNLTYAVKYLAGAYRAAHGDHERAIRYYAAGYYGVAKRQRPRAPLQLLAPQYRVAASMIDAHAQIPRHGRR
jgi:soluble lytic murein transglycosylase-like protein